MVTLRAPAHAYDAAGQLQSLRDENHTTPNTFYDYDPAGRLSEVRQTLGTGTIETFYGYDLVGNLTSVTDPNGNETSYLYDDFGQMLEQTSPVTGTTRYQYHLGGNLTSVTDAHGATTTRAYDASGRVTSAVSTRSGLPSETVTWTYGGTSVAPFLRNRLVIPPWPGPLHSTASTQARTSGWSPWTVTRRET